MKRRKAYPRTWLGFRCGCGRVLELTNDVIDFYWLVNVDTAHAGHVVGDLEPLTVAARDMLAIAKQVRL